jgi:SAM-dependent methyltransferase
MTSDHPPSAPERLGGPELLDEMPVRLGTPAQFERVRRFFHAAQFNEQSVCATLKIPDMSSAGSARRARIDAASVPPALLAALDLFMFGAAVQADDFREICGEETFAAFSALNLIRPAKHRDGAIVCPVWLYPVDGFVIASDRYSDADGETWRPPADAVFPALDAGTLKLLRLLPAARGGDTLDLCGGCGIVALHFSRTANRAVTSDITARSAHLAEFNGRLNGAGIKNLCGDLYAPVCGQHFDVISAHPPWVPSTGDAMVFRDGGDVGEAIIQRIVEGLARHLGEGGTAVVVSLGRDTLEAAYESRVRGWLGAAGHDCDVVLGVEKILTIDDLARSMRKLHFKDNADEADRMATRLRASGTDKFIYGALFIRRTGQSVTEPPLRLRMSSHAAAPDFDRLFAWRLHRRSRGFHDWLKAAKPRLAPHLEVNIRHVVKEDALVTGSVSLTAENAFLTQLRTDAWTVPLIAACEGRRTVEEVFDAARGAGQMPGDFTLAAFTDFLALLIERNFLEVDAWATLPVAQ